MLMGVARALDYEIVARYKVLSSLSLIACNR
jgi:hypothetical protein